MPSWFSLFSLVWEVRRGKVPCRHLRGDEELFNSGTEAEVGVHSCHTGQWLGFHCPSQDYLLCV